MGKWLADHDWFVLAGLTSGICLVLFLPRRLPRSVSYLMMMLSAALALGFDHSIGVPPFDVYDTNVKPGLTIADLLTALMYMPFGYLFVYVYRLLKIRGLGIPLYILAWSLFGTAFEALAVRFHVFTYKGWSLRYSFLVYLFVQLASLVFYHVLLRELARRRPA